MTDQRPEKMILDQEVTEATLRVLETLPDGWQTSPDTAIPLKDWLRLKDEGQDLTGVGVVIDGATDLELVRAHLADLPAIALSFPQFKDGRCYSHARRLRAIWGYEGLLLAFGDVQRDQLLNMSRTGINGFYMRSDQDLQESLKAFSTYSVTYQYH